MNIPAADRPNWWRCTQPGCPTGGKPQPIHTLAGDRVGVAHAALLRHRQFTHDEEHC